MLIQSVHFLTCYIFAKSDMKVFWSRVVMLNNKGVSNPVLRHQRELCQVQLR